MRLRDFNRVGRGSRSRYVARVLDTTGQAKHELVIAGDAKVITRIFDQSDFELKISPGGTLEEWQRTTAQAFPKQETFEPFLALEKPELLFKKPPLAAQPKNSVFVFLRRLTNGGTGYHLFLPLFVPTGLSLFFNLPPVCSCYGLLQPASGDPDLFLSLNGFAPVVATSTLGGTALDLVSFAGACWPWTHFIPIFRVFGFRASACAFTWGGFGLP